MASAASQATASTWSASAIGATRLAGTPWRHCPVVRGVYISAVHLGARLAKAGVSAHLLTLTSLVFAAAAAVAVTQGRFQVSAVLLIASGACDLLDGIVARAGATAGPFGALLDSTVDRIADGLPLLGLVVVYTGTGPAAAVPAAAMIGVFSVSYVRARAEALDISLPPLFMRRPERVVLLVVALLLGNVEFTWLPILAPVTLAVVAGIGAASLWAAVVTLRLARHACERRAE